jgi:hypothetical protein
MTSTTGPLTLDGCDDDPAAVLAFARAQKKLEDQAAREVMMAAAKWASMHTEDSLVGPADGWHETCLPLGGEGCPEVAEFAVDEYATALNRSTEAGRRYLSQAVEGHYRLTRCWARLVAGELQAWRLGFIADRTRPLSPAAAAFVDVHVAAVAHKIGPGQLARLIEEAVARFDPEKAEADRLAAAETRHVDIRLADVTVAGTVHVDGEVDLADALELETAVAAGAEQQRLAGSTESLDVRRSIALGDLARGQSALDLTENDQNDQNDQNDEAPTRAARPRRQVVLHVHLAQDALLSAGGLARLREARGPVTAEQVRTWCGNPYAQVTVHQVLDLGEHVQVDSYEASARLKNQVDLRDVTCVFPWCTRRAERCDHDHRVDHDHGGPTCSCNIAPICRSHHRAKTTGGWSYLTVEPGVYLWRSPLGYQFLKDHHGTLDVTPDDERRELARRFQGHFGPSDPEP